MLVCSSTKVVQFLLVCSSTKVVHFSLAELICWCVNLQIRSVKKQAQSHKYTNKVQQKESFKRRKPKDPFRGDPTNDIFQTKPPEEAVGAEKHVFVRKRR